MSKNKHGIGQKTWTFLSTAVLPPTFAPCSLNRTWGPKVSLTVPKNAKTSVSKARENNHASICTDDIDESVAKRRHEPPRQLQNKTKTVPRKHILSKPTHPPTCRASHQDNVKTYKTAPRFHILSKPTHPPTCRAATFSCFMSVTWPSSIPNHAFCSSICCVRSRVSSLTIMARGSFRPSPYLARTKFQREGGDDVEACEKTDKR